MHDGMYYDPIQGQDHEPFKFGNPSIFRSTLRQSRPNKAGLKCPSVRAYVRMYVHAYVCPCTISLFDFNEIWQSHTTDTSVIITGW